MRQSGKWAFVIQVDLPPNVRSLFRSRRGRRHIPGTRYTLTWSIHHEHVFVLSAYDSTSEPQHTGTFFLQWIELTMLDHMSPDDKASVRLRSASCGTTPARPLHGFVVSDREVVLYHKVLGWIWMSTSGQSKGWGTQCIRYICSWSCSLYNSWSAATRHTRACLLSGIHTSVPGMIFAPWAIPIPIDHFACEWFGWLR